MKKERKPDSQSIRSGLLKTCMVVVFSLLCFAVSAQHAAVSATATSPGKTSDNSSNAVLSEFVKYHPGDAQANLGMRYALILENPAAYPEFTQADLERIKSEQAAIMNRINYIDQQLKSGSNYEKASAKYQRELDYKATMDQKTNPAKTTEPQVDPKTTTPAMMNGNQ